MTRALLFDFGGTLDADGSPWSERFHSGYLSAGGSLPAAGFDEPWRRAEARLAATDGLLRFGLARMVAEQVALLRALLPDGPAVDAGRWAESILAAAGRIATRNREVLAALGARYRMAVLSNFTGNLKPCLVELGLASAFDHVFDSGAVGVRKPDPRFFTMALDALGCAPGDCWMVGDNPFADIAPAAALGCRTCWIAPPARPVPEGIAPDRRIASLVELPGAVG